MTDKPRIAFVTNTSFSGSTIFSLLADAHPQVVALGDGLNPRILRSRGPSFMCSCGERLQDCEFWTKVFAATREQGVPFSLEDSNLRYSYLHSTADRLLGRYYDDPLRAAVRWGAQRVWPPYRKHIKLHTDRNVAFARAVLQCSGKDVYIHNTKPLLMFYYLRQNPNLDIKYINMVRDARGFVYSAVKRGSSVKDAAHRWLRYHKRVDRLSAPLDTGQRYTLKYEELCGNTEAALKDVFAFLGVERLSVSNVIRPEEHHIAGNDLRLKKELHVRLDSSWEEHLSRADINVIESICRKKCEALGYQW